MANGHFAQICIKKHLTMAKPMEQVFWGLKIRIALFDNIAEKLLCVMSGVCIPRINHMERVRLCDRNNIRDSRLRFRPEAFFCRGPTLRRTLLAGSSLVKVPLSQYSYPFRASGVLLFKITTFCPNITRNSRFHYGGGRFHLFDKLEFGGDGPAGNALRAVSVK